MDLKSGVTFDRQTAPQQDKLHLVLISNILPHSGLHYSPIFNVEVRLVLPSDHPLVSKCTLSRKI